MDSIWANIRWIRIHDLYSSICTEKKQWNFFLSCIHRLWYYFWIPWQRKKTWDVFLEVTIVFEKLSYYPLTEYETVIQTLETFVVLMYDRSSTAATVNEARLDMFPMKQRSYNAIPPTGAAPFQHVKLAAYHSLAYRVTPCCDSQEIQLLKTGAGSKTLIHGESNKHFTYCRGM